MGDPKVTGRIVNDANNVPRQVYQYGELTASTEFCGGDNSTYVCGVSECVPPDADERNDWTISEDCTLEMIGSGECTTVAHLLGTESAADFLQRRERALGRVTGSGGSAGASTPTGGVTLPGTPAAPAVIGTTAQAETPSLFTFEFCDADGWFQLVQGYERKKILLTDAVTKLTVKFGAFLRDLQAMKIRLVGADGNGGIKKEVEERTTAVRDKLAKEGEMTQGTTQAADLAKAAKTLVMAEADGVTKLVGDIGDKTGSAREAAKRSKVIEEMFGLLSVTDDALKNAKKAETESRKALASIEALRDIKMKEIAIRGIVSSMGAYAESANTTARDLSELAEKLKKLAEFGGAEEMRKSAVAIIESAMQAIAKAGEARRLAEQAEALIAGDIAQAEDKAGEAVEATKKAREAAETAFALAVALALDVSMDKVTKAQKALAKAKSAEPPDLKKIETAQKDYEKAVETLKVSVAGKTMTEATSKLEGQAGEELRKAGEAVTQIEDIARTLDTKITEVRQKHGEASRKITELRTELGSMRDLASEVDRLIADRDGDEGDGKHVSERAAFDELAKRMTAALADARKKLSEADELEMAGHEAVTALRTALGETVATDEATAVTGTPGAMTSDDSGTDTAAVTATQAKVVVDAAFSEISEPVSVLNGLKAKLEAMVLVLTDAVDRAQKEADEAKSAADTAVQDKARLQSEAVGHKGETERVKNLF